MGERGDLQIAFPSPSRNSELPEKRSGIYTSCKSRGLFSRKLFLNTAGSCFCSSALLIQILLCDL